MTWLKRLRRWLDRFRRWRAANRRCHGEAATGSCCSAPMDVYAHRRGSSPPPRSQR